jgi:N-acetylglucosaminyldiphosphoundecaprenol N-acetyl-beta-D-mannosaminyltransferase
VADELAARLATRFPGLKVAGTLCPRFEADDTTDEQAIAAVNASEAQVVWVGLGSPKQDLWMARHRPRLRPPLLVGVGAAFDFLTGRKRQAPLWVQRSGLEWLFRLGTEPRRLWKRYAVYNPKFVAKVALQLAGVAHYG